MHVKKEVLCCKFLIFNNCNFVCFRVFLLYTSIESTCICKSFRFFLLRSESNLHFPHPAFGRSGCRCLTLRTRRNFGWFRTFIGLPIELYGHISTRRLWRLEMAKSGKNPKCSFFITKSAVEPKNE
jgi:hypothetical protein